jgi:hypothetical protein
VRYRPYRCAYIINSTLAYDSKVQDIKPDNIMIDLDRHWSTEAIDNWLEDDSDVMELFLQSVTYLLHSAQFVFDQTTDEVTPFAYEPLR